MQNYGRFLEELIRLIGSTVLTLGILWLLRLIASRGWRVSRELRVPLSDARNKGVLPWPGKVKLIVIWAITILAAGIIGALAIIPVANLVMGLLVVGGMTALLLPLLVVLWFVFHFAGRRYWRAFRIRNFRDARHWREAAARSSKESSEP